MENKYNIILSKETFGEIEDYASRLKGGIKCGSNLSRVLSNETLENLNGHTLLGALLNTKYPRIFAESAILGDGSDWTQTELSLLGDISIGMSVTIFDNGAHQNPHIHETPFSGHLIYTPGALLRNDQGHTPADWQSVTQKGYVDKEKYYRLYERRLLPALHYINAKAVERKRSAFITVPGMGCGQFAGPFRGEIGQVLKETLHRILDTHGGLFPNIEAVYYDPYNECENQTDVINGIYFLVRPLLRDNDGKSQLSKPSSLVDNFSECELYSFVAWDHVSWPGNDYYVGDRVTDDGVKAAATDTMYMMTGVEGHYSKAQSKYIPPPNFTNWSEVVSQNKIRLRAADNVLVY